ncbi:MAG: cobalamin-dependent protein [Thermodesulfovibrionales bacterium]|nr:cobalamin-dependent protein [Thermodesulfovibrionales bacterium]
MKVLFITPPFHAGVVEVAGRWVPLYFVCLAGALRAAGHEALIYDAMTKDVGYEEIEKKIREIMPDAVATTAITCTSLDAQKVMELAKKVSPEITTLCGGIHASFMYEEMFGLTDAIDYIVIGEGERTVVELADAMTKKGDVSGVAGIAYRKDGKVLRTAKRPFMEDLNNMPMAWDALDWSDYTYFVLPGSRLGAISTSRGCDKECTFCSQRKFWEGTWRARSPEDLMRELEELSSVHKADVVLLTDDYPTPDRQRWERFLDLLIERGLPVKFLMETRAVDIVRDKDILWKYKKAGIIHIYVGTEATDQTTLNYMKKDLRLDESKEALKLLRDWGIITETSLILGFSDDTRESIERTLTLAKEYNPDFAHFLAIAPWPYADIYEELKPFIEVRDYRKYNLIDPVIKPKAMTLEDVDLAIVNCYRDFYMNKFLETLETDDEFKKAYMMKAMKLMMSNSFIKKKLGMLGEMPEEIKNILSSSVG